jgi:hypothetical protein
MLELPFSQADSPDADSAPFRKRHMPATGRRRLERLSRFAIGPCVASHDGFNNAHGIHGILCAIHRSN